MYFVYGDILCVVFQATTASAGTIVPSGAVVHHHRCTGYLYIIASYQQPLQLAIVLLVLLVCPHLVLVVLYATSLTMTHNQSVHSYMTSKSYYTLSSHPTLSLQWSREHDADTAY